MTSGKQYLFTSAHLGFRNWTDDDIPKMAAISADPDVMEFFPAPATSQQTENFIRRMQLLFSQKGYCYFAVEKLDDGAFIGFIGLAEKDFESAFTPCVDIGWRLGKAYWNKGFATEGALRCLEYGFDTLKLEDIKSTASRINVKSIHIMGKAGMKKLLDFKHPLLTDHPRLVDCVCYEISPADFAKQSQ